MHGFHIAYHLPVPPVLVLYSVANETAFLRQIVR